MKYKLIFGIAILFLIIGSAYALDLKNTADVTVKGNHLEIDGKQVAEVKEFDSSDCIDSEILSRDSGAIIKSVDINGAREVGSVDNPRNVYEYLTNNGMYYSFGDGNHTYIVVIDVDNWHGEMLTKMDKWCLENSK